MPTYSAHTHRLRDNSPPQPSSLADQFLGVRAQTEALAKPLTPEDCQLQSMPDASPTKWHLAHLTWFFETFILEKFEPGLEPFDARFRVLFNSYYNGIGDKHPRAQRGLISRPGLADVLAYRSQVNERVLAVFIGAVGGVEPGTYSAHHAWAAPRAAASRTDSY